jgi:hypothetical protein
MHALIGLVNATHLSQMIACSELAAVSIQAIHHASLHKTKANQQPQ